MKAMGYPDYQLFLLIVQQAVVMSVLGFPGSLVAKAIYVITNNATMLPLDMTVERLTQVYVRHSRCASLQAPWPCRLCISRSGRDI